MGWKYENWGISLRGLKYWWAPLFLCWELFYHPASPEQQVPNLLYPINLAISICPILVIPWDLNTLYLLLGLSLFHWLLHTSSLWWLVLRTFPQMHEPHISAACLQVCRRVSQRFKQPTKAEVSFGFHRISWKVTPSSAQAVASLN